MIGLVFSHLQNSENIGYIIPNEEIELFLKDIAAHGHYDGKPGLYDELQTLENPALRGYLKLDSSVRGMIVHRPDDNSPTYDGTVPLSIVRGGRSQQIQMPVPAHRPFLIDWLEGSYPSYFILGPVVFERATVEGCS
jgi:S1-C subfamily serine protease